MNLALTPKDSVLLVIDVQERLAPAMAPELRDRTLRNLARLGEATKILGVDTIVTEQYPKGLGPTLPEVKAAFADRPVFPKLCFDGGADPAVAAWLEARRPRAIVLAGMEAHICVYQTARALVGKGFAVHVLKDAVASRTAENFATGLELAARAGAIPTATEVVLFDWLGQAGTEAFKAISKLVREP